VIVYQSINHAALLVTRHHQANLKKRIAGWAKKVSLIIFAITLSTASQFS